MKPNQSAHAQRGSALGSVLMVSLGLLLIIASVMSYSLSERRLNYREAMRIEARNAAEAVSEFGLSQVRKLMNDRSDFTSTRFTTGADSTSIANVPTTFWDGSNIVRTGTTAPELIIGLISAVTNSTTSALYYYDPTDPNNATDPLKGRYAFRFDVKVISKATVAPPTTAAGAAHTAHMTQTLSARASPLFSHAIFYNMDLELWPGPAMNILGGVHTNANMYVKKQSSSGLTVNFVGPVTVAGRLVAGVKCNIMNYDGTTTNLSTYTDNVMFSTGPGGLVGLYGPATGTTSPSFWRDHLWGNSTETAATVANFRIWSSQATGGNLQTSAHGVQVANPPGISTYIEDPTPGNGVDNSVNDARKMIEPPLLSTDTGYGAEAEAQKYSTRSGLYIVVNPSTSTRNGRKPNGTVVSLPGQTYRAFTNNGTEIILPGQPTWGSDNTTANTGPNTAALLTAAGISPLVTIRPNEMYDMRRATFNWGTGGTGAARSSGNPFVPKVLDMIDIDMRTLKLAVNYNVNSATTADVYRTVTPANGTATTNAAWTKFIYNPNATTESVTLSSLVEMTNFSASQWNGAIYIESVEAESRKDSGVRLINGRGPVASKSNGSGLTIATNDALYILGHYNADGTIDTATTGTTNSGRYPESTTETPCSIAGDALTILSTPLYTNNGTSIGQTAGWNDALSQHRLRSTNYTTAWSTTPLSNSNYYDGLSTSVACWRVPYANTSGTLATTSTTKLGGNHTEISCAFLTGIVPSNKDGNGQNCGGANNHPRFNEDFSATGTQTTVAIRGSIVAMFESRAATEPWLWRTFNAPARLWGFHELFNQGRFPPLTPRVMTYRRVDFNDINSSLYASIKSGWGL